MSGQAGEATEATLRALVDRYKVCWESFPEWSQIGGERKRTGAIVELYGTHDQPGVVPTAGCKHCIPVIRALLEVADHVAGSAREELSSIRAHSGIEYAVERGARPDIVVALTFGLSSGAPTAGSEAPLEEVRDQLRRLGASERSWRGSTRDSPMETPG